MPRTLKQYWRWGLVQVGLFDKGAFRLAIDRIYPDDTFIVSFPKSGNTWVRFLLANLLRHDETITFRNIDTIVPDIYTSAKIVNALPRPRYIKTHHTWFDSFPKSIYIVRDYRDVLVSYYNYHSALGNFSGTFSDYLAQVDRLHPFGTWQQHVTAALRFREQHPTRLLLLRYEDLLSDTVNELKKIVSFCGLAENQPLEAIADRCRFDNLRRNEQQHGSLYMDKSGKPFFREGKQGAWSTVFSTADLAKIEATMPLLKELGYSI